MKLKVCGMKLPSNIKDIANLSPNYMGFIFYDPSPRHVNTPIPKTKNIKRVGVFVNATTKTILQKIKDYQLDLIQLHGKESPKFCKNFEGIIPVIKSFLINKNFDFNHLESYIPYCTYFLFDTKGKYAGGNGKSFDWNLLKKYKYDKPLFISGGVGLNNITAFKEFLKQIHLPIHAIDVNSKFEILPAQKDINAVKQFKSIVDTL